MNFITKYRIKNNPNAIDKMRNVGIEEINYALENGYIFNDTNISGLLISESYINKYYNEIFESIKNNVNNVTNINYILNKLYKNNNDKFIDMILNDESLLQASMYEIIRLISVEDLLKLITKTDKKEELLKKIPSLLITENESLLSYICSLSPDVLSENSQILNIYIEKCSEDNFIKLLNDESIKKDNFNFTIKSRINDLSPDALIEVLKNNKYKKYIDNISNEYFKKMIDNNIGDIMKFYDDNFFKIGSNVISITDLPDSYKEKIKQGILDGTILFDKIPMPFIYEEKLLFASCTINSKIIDDPNISEIFNNKINAKSFEEAIDFLNKANYDLSKIYVTNPSLHSILINKILHLDEEQLIEKLKEMNYDLSNINELAEKLFVINKKFYIELFKESLKINHMSLFDFQIELGKEIYKEIYDKTKELVSMDDIYKNDFLRNNPYFTFDLIKSDIKQEIDLTQVKCDNETYQMLNMLSINMENVKRDENRSTLLKKSKSGKLYIELTTIENVKRALDVIKKEQLSGELFIVITPDSHNEDVISENLEYFKSLLGDDVQVKFKYGHKTDNKFYDDANTFDLDQVIKDEMFLDRIVKEIESRNLSPLEKYIAIYDIVKNFKPYTKEPENSTVNNVYEQSRSLYEYLNNSYFVCAGFADLYYNLCKKINLPCKIVEYSPVQDDEMVGHAYNYINIEDEKYGINGYYAIDPTNEEFNEHFLENYGLFGMTKEQENKHFGNEDFESDVLLSYSDKEKLKKTLEDYHNKQVLFKLIKHLDPDMYLKVIDLDFSKSENVDILFDYLSNKINKKIDEFTIVEAAVQVKEGIFKNMNMNIEKLKYAQKGINKKDSNSAKYFFTYMDDFYEKNLHKTFKEISTLYNENYNEFKESLITYLRYRTLEGVNISRRGTMIIKDPAEVEKFKTCEKQLQEANVKYKDFDDLIEIYIELNETTENMTLEEYLDKMMQEKTKIFNIMNYSENKNITNV